MLIKNIFRPVTPNTALVLLLFALIGLSPVLTHGDDLLTPYYEQTSWPTIHRDSCNSNYVPVAGPDSLEINWAALDGSRLLTAATLGPTLDPEEWNVYNTTGIGATRFHLYALDHNNGGIVWKSKLLDRQAVYSAVVVDVDGDIYISDSEELFAFYSDGSLKWSIPISDTVYTTAITTDGYLIAITENGEVMAVNRNDGSLADTLYLVPPPEGRVINTPAIHPVTNRIYIVTGGFGVDGRFYGIDFISGSFSIKFEVQMENLLQHSATSPTISFELFDEYNVRYRHIYVADRDKFLYAFNEDGSLAWEDPYPLSGTCLGSPSIGPNGEIYFLDGSNITAIRDLGSSAERLWDTQYEFNELAKQLPDYGYPRVARANSVVTVAANYVYFAVSCGYLFTHRGVEYFIPHRTLVCTVDPTVDPVDPEADVAIIAEVEVRDVCECAPSVASDGTIYIPHGSVSSSIAYRLNRVLPPELRVPEPLGGITALRPASYLNLTKNRVQSAKDKGKKSLSSMETGDIDGAATSIAQGEGELKATFSVIDKAVVYNELNPNTANEVQDEIDKALTLSDDAKKSLRAGDLNTAEKVIKDADKELEKALKKLEKGK